MIEEVRKALETADELNRLVSEYERMDKALNTINFIFIIHSKSTRFFFIYNIIFIASYLIYSSISLSLST